MKASFKRRWLQMLAPKYYAKGKGSLREHYAKTTDADKFCCLGVAMDLAEHDWDIPQMEHKLFWGGLLQPEGCKLIGITRKDMLALAKINDATNNWGKVRAYIKERIKPNTRGID